MKKRNLCISCLKMVFLIGNDIEYLLRQLSIIGIIFCSAVTQAQDKIFNTYITKWQGGAKGAYSFTFDDGMAGQWQHAVPILNEYNIHATFFLIGASVQAWYSPGQFGHIHVPQMLNIAAAGHEIASHTYNHPSLVDINDADLHAQMFLNHNFLNDWGFNPYSFAYPFARTNERVQAIVGQYVEFARGGYPMVTNSSNWNELNPLDLRWSSRGDNHYECVDIAVDTGTWAIGVFHEVGFNEGGPTVGEFEAFVKYVSDRCEAGDIWAGTLGDIACYIREKYIAEIMSTYNEEINVIQIILLVDLPYPYIVPLTLRTEINDYFVSSVKQSQMPIPYQVQETQSGRVVQYNAIPNGGDVKIELMERSNQ